jgi:UDP-glucose 4-epimerase
LNLLVTGGAGYIGSVVTADLLRAGHSVVVFDDLSHGRQAAVPPGAPLVVGDIGSRPQLDALFRGQSIDAVLHFAALVEAAESMRAPERYFRTNTAGSLTLLESMREHGVNRLVFSSTAAVYGTPQRIPIEETDPLHPTNAYGESKLLVERMLEWFHTIYGLRYASLRYFNAAGSAGPLGEDHRPESHLIPLVLRVALGKQPHINICGTDYPTPDGTCIRDYIHVLDLAAAHRLALEALAQEGRMIYNLGLERGFSVREVIEVARRVTGHAIPAIESPRRPGDPPVLIASSKKIRSELSWKPQFSDLPAIIASAWDWHRSHPDGYA